MKFAYASSTFMKRFAVKKTALRSVFERKMKVLILGGSRMLGHKLYPTLAAAIMLFGQCLRNSVRRTMENQWSAGSIAPPRS